MTENEIATLVVVTALDIHRKLGPGLFETAYETILSYELERKGLSLRRQTPIPIVWNDLLLENAYKADLIVENKVILEVKSLEHMAPVHEKQLLTYLRLADMRLGLLLNFGEPLMKDGIRRVINGTLPTPRVSQDP